MDGASEAVQADGKRLNKHAKKTIFVFTLLLWLSKKEKLTDKPLDYKNVPIEAKPKRGRKPKVNLL